MAYITTDDIINQFRSLTASELTRAENIIPAVESRIQQYAKNAGKDIDEMIENGDLLEDTLKSVEVDIVARVLMTSTDSEPMTQVTESALGYSMQGTFLNPGGGVFIKNSELRLLGIKRQRMGTIDYEYA